MHFLAPFRPFAVTDTSHRPRLDARIRQKLKPTMFRGLSHIERMSRRTYELQCAPGFIIGPPRSGTTVIRQVLSAGLRTSYFTNLMAAGVSGAGLTLPITTTWLARRMGWFGAQARFANDHGKIEGAGAPAEGELIWATWFGSRYDPVTPAELVAEQRAAMYRSVAAVESIVGAPFVNKTTALSVRIEALCSVFPDAYFLRVRRDPRDTAQSIYLARTSRYPGWLGARPRECADMEDADMIDQVCAQVVHTERHIDRSALEVGGERFIDVHYRQWCETPLAEFERVRQFMEHRGATAQSLRSVPRKFEMSHGQKVDDDTYERMKAALSGLDAS